MNQLRSVFMKGRLGLFLLLGVVLLQLCVFAELTKSFNVQGVLKENDKPVDSALGVDVTFALWPTLASTTKIWEETIKVYPDKNGFFTARLGTTTANKITANFDSHYYLSISYKGNYLLTDKNNAQSYKTPLLSSPYSISSINSVNAVNSRNHTGGYISMESDVVNLSGTLNIVDNFNIRTVEVPKKNMLAGWIILDSVTVLWGTSYHAESSWFQLKINNDYVKTDSIILMTPKNDEKAVLTEVGNGYFKVKVTNKSAVISYVLVNAAKAVSAVPPPFNHAPQAENVSFLVAPSAFAGKKGQWVKIGELDGYDYEDNADLEYYSNDGTTGDQAGTTGYNWTMRLTGKNYEYMIKSDSWYNQIVNMPANSERNLFDVSGTSPDEHRYYYCQDKGLNGVDVKQSNVAEIYARVGNTPLFPPGGWKEELVGPWPPISWPEPEWGYNEMVDWKQKVVSPLLEAIQNPMTEATNPLLSGLNNAFASKDVLTQYALKTEVAGLALADNSVTSPKLVDFSVISSKLADNSVISSKIADGTISNLDIMTGAGINTSKLSGAVSAITGNGLGTLAFKSSITESDITGGINAGSLVGQLTDSQISGLSASKVSGQFADSQISGLSASKVSGQFTDNQLAGISASKITGTLAGSQLGAGVVTGDKLAAGAIAGASAFKTVASVANLPASTGSGALAFVNSGTLGETGMYMDMMGGSWHKISAFRAPLGDMDGTLSTSKISGLGTLATKNAVDYNSTDIANKPALGSLAYKSSLAATDIPALDASKIATGTLADARIASVSASKITGTLSTTAIPNLDASKITTGTLADARIASISASKVTGTLATTAIPNIDASKITTGTISLSKVTFANSTENLSNWMEYKAAYSLNFGGFIINIPAQLKFKQGSTFNGNVYPEVNSTGDTTGYYLGTSSLKWRRIYAWKYYGTNTAITAADLNEKHNVSGAAEDGDVMMISGSDQMSVCNVANSTKVAGVYRGTEGGLTMNDELKDGKPIVYTGRYDVKVDATRGAIEPGDLLVSSANPGYAMKAPANPQAGTIIGKALKSMPAGQKGKLLVLVTLQ